MTREEAIQVLRHIIQVADTSDCGIKEIDGIDEEALNIAIKALEQEPCDDAVSRQKVLDVWHTSYSDNREENEEIQYKKIAFELPPVNPQEPKTGHWIEKDGYSDCSECGSHIVIEWDYCPKCGAKMVEPQESEEV